MGIKRVVTALIFIPLFYLLVKYLSPFYFFLFVVAGVLIGQFEFYRLYFKQVNIFMVLGLICGFIVLLGFYSDSGVPSGDRDAFLSLTIFLTLVTFMFFKKDIANTLTGVSVVLTGLIYIAWPLGHLISLRDAVKGQYLIFFIFLVTWASDTGAFYVGKILGRHKLSPRMSPGKTIEGAVGGFIACMAAVFLSRWWFLPGLSIEDAVIMGLLIGIFAPIGDLSESMFKRSANVKDTGTIVPAHGGLMDRVDSLIFTVPVFYYYLFYRGLFLSR